ncbi:hypothetical protein [Rathayibacter tanaceti]|uniref:Uncharacterized protein n=1 Tax=Rathayibacter tanaceti TaxID=1671680 RepID=A0AAE6V768_9MICO|nr:hypothetical protein [Rathayibacter tanaceti]QHC55116.1 hypothetical protein GSU10_05355 [Rathayibacter tanaceti]
MESVDRELELLFDGRALHRSLFDACPDLAHGERAGCGELDEALLLGFELVELPLELSSGVAVLRKDVRHGAVDGSLDTVQNVFRESLLGHGGDDGCFDLFDPTIHHRAKSTLVGGTDEVFVGPATAGGLGVEQSATAGVRTVGGRLKSD